MQIENVLGFDVPVLANRRKSLRDFVEGCRAHGDREFLVLDDRRITHDQFVDLVAASVVPMPGAVLSADELHAWAAKSLAPYKVPTAWDIRSGALPRNAAAKVVKYALCGRCTFTGPKRMSRALRAVS